MRNLLFFILSVLLVSCADPVGTEPEADVESRFEQKMVAMEFTSVYCTYCPILPTSVKEVMKDYPGRLIPVSFHLDFGGSSDPMSLPVNRKFYNKVATGEGLPMFALNFRKSSTHIVNEYAKIADEMDGQGKRYPALCGVSVSSEYDEAGGVISVTAGFISDVVKDYRYHIFLVEDSIRYFQAGSDDDEYIHDCVFRAMAGDNIKGIRLNDGNPLEVGAEYEVTKSIDVDPEWNVKNMKVVVAMLVAEGNEYYSNNAAVAEVGQSSDYPYKK